MDAKRTVTRIRNAIIFGLVAIGMIVYSFNLNGPLFWDDLDLIVNNAAVQSPGEHLATLLSRDMLAGSGQVSNYYRPLVMVSFAANWALGGTVPWGYHLVSNLLHIASAILLFLLFSDLLTRLRVITNRPDHQDTRKVLVVAGVAALFWLIHPVQAEAVAYIAGRGDPLAIFFMLTSILLWMKTVTGNGVTSGDADNSRIRLFSLLAAVLALLSRETAVLLPAYVVVILMVLDKNDSWWQSFQKAVRKAWPFILLSGIYVIARLTILNFDNTLNFYHIENEYTASIWVRLWTYFSALLEYFRLSIWPTGLHFEHTVPWQLTPWHWRVLAGAAAVLGCLVWVARAWSQGNRLPFLGVALFFIPFALSSGVLVPINSAFSEHWLYLSLMGVGVLLSVYTNHFLDWLSVRAKRKFLKPGLLACIALYALFFAVSGMGRNQIVNNQEALFLEVLSFEPGNVRALNNLANVYKTRGDLALAEQYWNEAAEADPTQAYPIHNLADLSRDQGDLDRAEALYLKAISLRPSSQNSYRNLAGILISQKRHANALEVLMAVRELSPRDPSIYFNIAQVQQALGRDDLARAALDDGQPFLRTPEALATFDELRAQLR